MLAHTFIPRPWEREADKSGIQGQADLQSESQDIQGYMENHLPQGLALCNKIRDLEPYVGGHPHGRLGCVHTSNSVREQAQWLVRMENLHGDS